MAIDFPNSPSTNDVYTVGKTTWRYDGQKWTVSAYGRSGPASVYAGDSAPAIPSSGTLWFNTTNGKTYAYYTDGDSSQWVEIGNADPTFSALTNKGDILTRSSTTMTKLGVGTDKYVLTADSTTSTGLTWTGSPWNTAWGVVGRSTLTSTFSTSATHTVFQDTGSSVTFTPSTLRLYKATYCGNPYPSGGLQAMVYQMVESSTVKAIWNLAPDALNSGNSFAVTLSTYFTAATNSATTYKIQLRGSSSNTAVSDYASSPQLRQFWIEDIGPA